MAQKFAVFPSADLNGNLVPTTLANVVPQATTTWSGLTNATAYRGFVLRNPSEVFKPFTVPAAMTIGQWSIADAETSGEALVTITAFPADSGSPITALQYRIGTGDPVSLVGPAIAVYSISGLTNDAAVNVQVRAGNSAGFGDWSDTKSVTPTGVVTGQPSPFEADMWDAEDTEEGGTLAVTIGTFPDENASEITSTEFSVGGGAWTTLAGNIAGLTDNVAVGIRLRAVNAQGAGGPSDTKTRTPTTAAAAVPSVFAFDMWNVTAPGVSEQIRITIDELPAANPGISSVEYRLGEGTPVALSSTAPGTYNVDGLTNAVSVNVQLRAVNSEGAGGWSDVKSATPFASDGPVISASFVGGVLTLNSDTEGTVEWATTLAPVAPDEGPDADEIEAGTGAYDFGDVEVLSGQFIGALPLFDTPDINTTGTNGARINLVQFALDKPPSNIVRVPFHIAAQASVLADDADAIGWWKSSGLVEGTSAEAGILVQWTDEVGTNHYKRIGTTRDVPFTPGYAEVGSFQSLRTDANGFARTAYLAGGYAVFIVAERTVASPSGEATLWAENETNGQNNSWSVFVDPRGGSDGRIRAFSQRFTTGHSATHALSIPPAEFEKFIIAAVFHPASTGSRGRVNINGRYDNIGSGDVVGDGIPLSSVRMTLGGRTTNDGGSQGSATGLWRVREKFVTANITNTHFDAVMAELGGKFSITIGP